MSVCVYGREELFIVCALSGHRGDKAAASQAKYKGLPAAPPACPAALRLGSVGAAGR